MRTHSTATFRPTATMRRNASATASVRELPPSFGEREIARSSPESACVPVTIVAPSARRVPATSSANSHSPGLEKPTTWVTTIKRRSVPLIASRKASAVRPLVLATTIFRRPSSRALSTANRAASGVFCAPGASK